MSSPRSSFVGLLVLCVAVTFALLVVAVYRDPNVFTTFPPPCIFRKATGIYCPGCGSTRALRALVGGDFLAALRYNPLTIAVLFLIPLLFIFNRPKFRAVYRRLAVVICVAVIVFFALRNVPLPAFDFLRPPVAHVSSSN